MTIEIAIVLGLLLLAIVLFATEKFSVDIITLVMLILLAGLGIITPSEAFEGFGSDFIFILASIFIISGAMRETGILDSFGNTMAYLSRKRKGFITISTMVIPGLVSGFMNNTTVTALFINPILGLARKRKISPSKLLMPMAFASILGGTCTLIGTSTNVAVSAYLERSNLGGLSLFEIFPIGIILLGVGILYLLVFGKRILPDHKIENIAEAFGMREYLSEIVVLPGSRLIGQRIFQSGLNEYDLRVLNIIRNGAKIFPTASSVAEEGDVFLIEGKMENLLKIKEASGVEIRGDLLDVSHLQGTDHKLAEVLVTPMSDLVNSTIKEARFRQRYGLVVLAVYRHGTTLREKIGDVKMEVGDLLMVQGATQQLDYLRESHSLAILDRYTPKMTSNRKGVLTIVFFVMAIILGSLKLLPLSISFLAAAVLIVLIKAVPLERVYEYIEWRLLILIGGMTAFGVAMGKTGADIYLSHMVVDNLKDFGPLAIMGGLMVLTVILTQPLSNAAAALVILPFAIQIANELAVNPRTFAIAVMMSASISLIAPFEPSSLLVFGPGKYKIWDYIKLGSGLTLLLIILLVFLIPMWWPL